MASALLSLAHRHGAHDLFGILDVLCVSAKIDYGLAFNSILVPTSIFQTSTILRAWVDEGRRLLCLLIFSGWRLRTFKSNLLLLSFTDLGHVISSLTHLSRDLRCSASSTCKDCSSMEISGCDASLRRVTNPTPWSSRTTSPADSSSVMLLPFKPSIITNMPILMEPRSHSVCFSKTGTLILSISVAFPKPHPVAAATCVFSRFF